MRRVSPLAFGESRYLTVREPGAREGYAWVLPAVLEEEWDGYRVELTLDNSPSDLSLRCTRVVIEAPADGEVTRRALRAVKLGEMVDAAVRVAAAGRVEFDEFGSPAIRYGGKQARKVSPADTARATRKVRPTRGAGRWRPDELRHVLEVIDAAPPRGQTAALAREFGLSTSGAKWLARRARTAQAAGEL